LARRAWVTEQQSDAALFRPFTGEARRFASECSRGLGGLTAALAQI
jgi:hypothetical protein